MVVLAVDCGDGALVWIFFTRHNWRGEGNWWRYGIDFCWQDEVKGIKKYSLEQWVKHMMWLDNFVSVLSPQWSLFPMNFQMHAHALCGTTAFAIFTLVLHLITNVSQLPLPPWHRLEKSTHTHAHWVDRLPPPPTGVLLFFLLWLSLLLRWLLFTTNY